MEPASDELTLQGSLGKRRRVALACDVCRTRKSRCDGTRPRCGMCYNLGLECIYSPPVTAANVIVQKVHLESLELRLKALETNLSTIQTTMSGVVAHLNSKNQQRESQQEPCHEPLVDLAGPEDAIDAMGAVTFADEEDCGYFGPSSNIAFLRHLSRAVSGSESSQNNINSPQVTQDVCDGGFVSATRPPSPLSERTSGAKHSGITTSSMLPSPEETLQLIRRYFGDTGLLFPYIHPPSFLETYHQFKNNAQKIRRTWLGLLNIMLAMAKVTDVSTNVPAETRIKDSTVYYRQALSLCRGEILRGTTLEVVQFLLLMAQYLQGTQKSVQAWTMHGLAVKAALQLGLHSKDASLAFSHVDFETRKRTWFGCVVLDRTLSMTFGRPAAIPNSYVQLDLPVVDDNSVGTPSAENEILHQGIEFFNCTITLYKHMGNIIDQLYGHNLGCETGMSVSDLVSRALSIEHQLFSWVISVPHGLRRLLLQELREKIAESDAQQQIFPLKFRVILTLRYLHVQILLHRPILVKFLDASLAPGLDPSDDRILNEIGHNSVKKGVESAMNIIDIIYELLSAPGRQRDFLGAWWFTLYYTFNAALFVIGATWVQRKRQITKSPGNEHASIQDIEIYPGRALLTMSRLDRGNRMVDRCRHYLEQLISILHLHQQYPGGTSLPTELGLFTMNSAPAGPNGASDIECGEFMLDDLFTNITQGPQLESW